MILDWTGSSVHLGGFLVVASIVIVTPGPDTALTIKNALQGGRGGGIATGAGVASGQAAWALATGAGVVALLAASRPVFLAVRVAGASYLVVLGLHALCQAISRNNGVAESRVPAVNAAAAYRQGLLSNLSNPKMAVFFISLIPQFVAGRGDPFAATLALGLLFAAMTLVWLSVYAVLVARLGDILRRSWIRRVLDALTGAVLTGLGIRLAIE